MSVENIKKLDRTLFLYFVGLILFKPKQSGSLKIPSALPQGRRFQPVVRVPVLIRECRVTGTPKVDEIIN